MGKKKQKVRWTAVEENFFGNQEDSSPSGSENTPPRNKPTVKFSGGIRNHNHHDFKSSRRQWNAAPIAPRFERKYKEALESSRGFFRNHRNQNGYFETVQLPDGFTKIRSKNLDILFKRDYYAQRLENPPRSNASSEYGDNPGAIEEHYEEANNENNMEEEEETAIDGEGHNENGGEIVNDERTQEEEKSEEKENVDSQENNEDKSTTEAEEKPNDYPVNNFTYSPNAPPFFPASMAVSTPTTMPQSRPNLFLYSPTSNTMIPCEEIIIPNPVLGPDGNPVYPGPSNIYLAFPVDNTTPPPPGATLTPTTSGGYITTAQATPPPPPPPPPHAASFMPYDQYGVPYAHPHNHYNHERFHHHSTSSDAGTTTEPGSADSTTPHSPPDLSGYSPASWASHANGVGYQYHLNHNAWYHMNNRVDLIPEEEGVLEDEDEAVTNAGQYNNGAPNQNGAQEPETESVQAQVPMYQAESNSQANDKIKMHPHIPGLCPDNSVNNSNGLGPKRPSKKRRKKKTTLKQSDHSHGSFLGQHRGSTSSEDHHNYNILSENKKQNNGDDDIVVKRILSRDDNNTNGSSNFDSVCSSMVSSFSSEICDSKMESISEEKHQNLETINKNVPTAVNSENTYTDAVKTDNRGDTVISNDSFNVQDEVKVAAPEEQSSAVTKDIDENDTCDQKDIDANVAIEKGAENLKGETAAVKDTPVNTSVKVTDPESAQDNKNEEISSAQPPEKIQNVPDSKKEHEQEEKHDKKQEMKSTDNDINKKTRPQRRRNNNKNNRDKQNKGTKPHPALDTNESPNGKDFLIPPISDDAVVPLHTKEEGGEWETKKRKSKRSSRHNMMSSNNNATSISVSEVVPDEIKPETEVPEAVAKVVCSEAKSDEAEKVASCEIDDEDKKTLQSSKRPNRKKNKKKASQAQEKEENKQKSPTRQVLVQDGAIDFTPVSASFFGVMPRSKSAREESILKSRLEKLFVSSIGHGIQYGPIFSGRLGTSKYTPPDRSDEIPMKFRQTSNTDDDPSKTSSSEPLLDEPIEREEEREEVKMKPEQDLALD